MEKNIWKHPAYLSKDIWEIYMSYFTYACKTEGKNGISRLISELLHTLDSSLRDRLFVYLFVLHVDLFVKFLYYVLSHNSELPNHAAC